MHNFFLKAGAVSGALSVALGAFGAHSLKKILSIEALTAFETGIRYQFYHAFALLLIAVLHEKFGNKWMIRAGYCFLTGIILFCGSLYILAALNATHTMGLNGIGILTPFGGLFFIAGWLLTVLGISSR